MTCKTFARQSYSFNTQPPEGGWAQFDMRPTVDCRFNTQPPEGGWKAYQKGRDDMALVSTHSRLKAAGLAAAVLLYELSSFNTQPPEGGWVF